VQTLPVSLFPVLNDIFRITRVQSGPYSSHPIALAEAKEEKDRLLVTMQMAFRRRGITFPSYIP
jgi:hypothetical protein